jgi:hypothetical protein
MPMETFLHRHNGFDPARFAAAGTNEAARLNT